MLYDEHGSFMPLAFTTTGGMGKKCIRYHNRLAELIAAKKGEHDSQTISWIRARISFALCAPSVSPGLPSWITGEAPYRAGLTTTIVILKSQLPKEPLTLFSVS